MFRVYVYRLLSCLAVIFLTGILFFGYLPKRNWLIADMNETVGENKIDIICFGSSHMYNGLNPIQMYEEKGIASYIVARGGQAPWQSYYYIKEACKKQNPKILICDTFMFGCVQSDDDYDDSQTVRNMLDCPFSLNKIFTVLDSAAESKLDIILNFPYRHDEEFNGFSLNKLYGEKNYSMGYQYRADIVPGNKGDEVEDVIEIKAISNKNEKYLRKIINYCKRNNIELILTNTPWSCVTKETEMYYNYIAMIAEENGFPFIDGCKLYKEIGIDYDVDCCAADGHLNDDGVTKYTKWFESYLKDNYELSDVRNDASYQAYEEGIKWIERCRKGLE